MCLSFYGQTEAYESEWHENGGTLTGDSRPNKTREVSETSEELLDQHQSGRKIEANHHGGVLYREMSFPQW